MKAKKQLKAGQYSLTDSEIKKITDYEPDFRNRVILRLLGYCGMRRAEICNLCVENIDAIKNRLFVTGKRGKERVIPVQRAIINDLWQQVTNRSSGPVFPSKTNNRSGIATKTINCIVSAAAKRASVVHPDKSRKNVNPHLLRHSYAHRLKKAGVSMEALSAVLGHDNINTTVKTYGILSEDDICEELKTKVFGDD